MNIQELSVVCEEDEIVAICHAQKRAAGPRRNDGKIGEKAWQQLAEYLAGKRKHFDLPLAPKGTKFQQAVWKELLKIPYGKTTSYQELAAAIDKPKAARAVGMALNKNPIPLLIPCHRVIGKNGSLTGFALGLETKAWLLKLEQAAL